MPHWRGTPLVQAMADGRVWEVLLETTDTYLDRYKLPMLNDISEVELAHWRPLIQAAWELLVRHHEWAAGPIAGGVPVIVPLVPRSDLDSATSPAAFGAIATSLPPSPVSMAETLVHEFQHIKLSGLMDMLPLIEPIEQRAYAPWRDDPRPLGGILQGVYAFTGIVRFWDIQRQLETEPDAILRANVLYERWRLAIDLVTDTLLASGFLTPEAMASSLSCGSMDGGGIPARAHRSDGDRAGGRARQLAHLAAHAYGARCRRGRQAGGRLPARRAAYRPDASHDPDRG